MQEAEICLMGHTEDIKHRGFHGELKWAWSNGIFLAYAEGRNGSFIRVHARYNKDLLSTATPVTYTSSALGSIKVLRACINDSIWML